MNRGIGSSCGENGGASGSGRLGWSPRKAEGRTTPRTGSFSAIILAMGAVVVWNCVPARGQDAGAIVGWGEQAVVAIAGGGDWVESFRHSFSLGLKSDGALVAWGDNSYGQCNVPAPNRGFVAITAGNLHSLGLKADGSVVAWGKNTHCQCNVPAPNTGFVAVAAGGGISLGLKAHTGDVNCDGVVDFGDINPFVQYLSNFTAWQATYPRCHALNGDIDGDGTHGQGSFGDINPFVALLSGG